MKKIIYCCLFFIVAVAGCEKDKIKEETKQEITPEFLASLNLRFEAKNNAGIDSDVLCEFDGDVIQAVIPKLNPDKEALILSFDEDKVTVQTNGNKQLSGVSANNFAHPVTYRFIFSNGEERDFEFKVK